MKLLRSVAALLAMTSGLAMAQQKGPPESGSDERLRLDNIVVVAAIEVVQTDLGVGDDVARKLTRLHNDYQAAITKEQEKAGLPPPGQRVTNEEDRQKVSEIRGRMNDEFIPKAKQLLSVDQFKRFQQIQLQLRLRTGPAGLLTLVPDVASELKLTDDQRQSLNALLRQMRQGFGLGGIGTRDGQERLRKVQEEYAAKAVEVLTEEQRVALTKLKGSEFDVSKLPPALLRQFGIWL